MKQDDRQISDELLNAFVDSQLDSDERSQVFDAAQEDPQVATRVCELRHVKELTQHAYQHAQPPTRGGHKGGRSRRKLYRAAAALVLVAVGGLAGWLAHSRVPPTQPVARILELDEASQLAHSGKPIAGKRILVHLSNGDPAHVRQALDTTEALIRRHERRGADFQLQIIANADGLNVLREDVTPHAARIRRMAREYDNVSFLACRKAIERLHEQGVDVRLVPEAAVAPSALETIVDRLESGWIYVKA